MTGINLGPTEYVPRVDAKLLVTGAAAFAGDVLLPGLLHGKILRSTQAHALIKHLDTSRARKLPGVRAVLTGREVPSTRFGSLEPGRHPDDRQILATNKVRYAGDPLAAVAAVDRDTAEEALDLIKVEYEPLPAVFSAEEALKPGAPLVHDWAKNNIYMHPVVLQAGNVEQGFAASYYVREDTYRTHHMNHAFLETRVCLASYDTSGKLTVWPSSQIPFSIRTVLACVLGLPENKIQVIHPFVGGAFGGKSGIDNVELVASCLSIATCKPVIVSYSRSEQFLASRGRHEISFHFKTGVAGDGTLLAKKILCTFDGGAYTNEGFHVVINAAGLADLLYRVPNYYFEGRRVYTNKPPCGAMRSYDNVMIRFAEDQHMDQIAEDLGLDTVEFMQKNCRHPQEVTNAHYVVNSCGLKECIERAAEAADWKEKRGKLSQWKGIGIALGAHTSGYRNGPTDASGALIKIDRHGDIVLFSGTEDHGQGARTTMVQLAAGILGVPIEEIKISTLDTETCPTCRGCFASRGTLQGGWAAVLAAEDALRQILQEISSVLNVPAEQLKAQGGRIFITSDPDQGFTFKEALIACDRQGTIFPIVGRGFFEPDTEWIDSKTGKGNVSAAYGFGAQIVEVEVDPKLGDVRVTNVIAANDPGKVINMLSLNGQSEGSIHMGLSHALFEQLHIDKQGRVLNPSLLDYKIGTSLDVASVQNIWVETKEPKGPHGAKGICEATLIPTVAALANAIYNATKIRFYELPITPEKLLQAIDGRRRITDKK